MKISVPKIFNSIGKVFSRPNARIINSTLEKAPLKDVIELQSKTLERNPLSFVQMRTLGFKSGFHIKDSNKKIGFVDYCLRSNVYAPLGSVPDSWIIKEAKPNKKGFYPLKPFLYICELSMNDRIGKQALVPRSKKYGAMAMQKLLEIAQKEGCDSRIALLSDTLGKTGFKPGKFYSKMGFSLSQTRIAELAKEEKMLNIAHNKIDGRYYEESSHMFLTNPECIVNYEV